MEVTELEWPNEPVRHGMYAASYVYAAHVIINVW